LLALLVGPVDEAKRDPKSLNYWFFHRTHTRRGGAGSPQTPEGVPSRAVEVNLDRELRNGVPAIEPVRQARLPGPARWLGWGADGWRSPDSAPGSL